MRIVLLATTMTVLAFGLSVPAQAAPQQGPGLAPTPPMGWNSWNKFGCDINEDLIYATADAMVDSGMRDAGYEYVNIDDCWMAPTRDADGRLQPDPERFPNGIKAIADYVHERDLKLGIYSSAGTATCQGLPASLGHEQVDAQTFADWGVDYLKYDNCNNQGVPAEERYAAMGEALAATGRPIVYSICEWGENDPWLWGNDVGGDLWRTTGDITDSWTSAMSLLDQQVGLEQYSGPNGWNDPDMLEVGNGGMTDTEYRAHMSLWSLLNAPLLAGNDLRAMDDATLRILTDPDVIEVNQDWGGEQGSKRRDDGDVEVWAKPMSDGSVAVVLLNRDGRTRTIAAQPDELELPAADRYAMRDVWTDETTETDGVVRASVPSHGAAMFVVRPNDATPNPPSVTLGAEVPEYVAAGQPVTVTSTLYNDGTRPVRRARIDIQAPDGWTVTPDGAQPVPVVRPGQRADVEWRLTSGSADLGRVELTTNAVWRTGGQAYESTSDTSFTTAEPPGAGQHQLSDLQWAEASNGWGPVERDASNGEQEAGDGGPLTIAGTTYEKGLGVHAPSAVSYFLAGDCTELTAEVGVDDETDGQGSVGFEIWGDGEQLAATDPVASGDPAVPIAADLAGVQVVELRANDGGDGINYDHADWATPVLTC